jgi:hypothetical protein
MLEGCRECRDILGDCGEDGMLVGCYGCKITKVEALETFLDLVVSCS